MEACCTCATLLSAVPRFAFSEDRAAKTATTTATPTEKPLPENRHLDCCSRVICGRCIHNNSRFRSYCPYCQTGPSSSVLHRGRDGHRGQHRNRSHAQGIDQDGNQDSPPSYEASITTTAAAAATYTTIPIPTPTTLTTTTATSLLPPPPPPPHPLDLPPRYTQISSAETTTKPKSKSKSTHHKHNRPKSTTKDPEKAALGSESHQEGSGSGSDSDSDDSDVEGEEGTLHFLNHAQDTISSLSLRYNIPAALIRSANNLGSDHLLAGRRTVLIPGRRVSLSPRPVEGEEEERRKAKIRRWMVACKVSDYDVAVFYLEHADYDFDHAIEVYFADEAWERDHPLENDGEGGRRKPIGGLSLTRRYQALGNQGGSSSRSNSSKSLFSRGPW